VTSAKLSFKFSEVSKTFLGLHSGSLGRVEVAAIWKAASDQMSSTIEKMVQNECGAAQPNGKAGSHHNRRDADHSHRRIFRVRRHSFRAHGWLGLFALVCSEYLAFPGIEPVATYFPLVAPTHTRSYLFGFVWIGFLLLLEPINHRMHLPSFAGDLRQGYRGRLYSFLIAGWVMRLVVGIVELLGAQRMDLYFSHWAAMENFSNARARLPGIPRLCARMLRDVRERGVAAEPEICRRKKIFRIAGLLRVRQKENATLSFSQWRFSLAPFCPLIYMRPN
jgi:hypothetical protein